jgi:hypothetical protein
MWPQVSACDGVVGAESSASTAAIAPSSRRCALIGIAIAAPGWTPEKTAAENARTAGGAGWARTSTVSVAVPTCSTNGAIAGAASS